MNRVFPVLVLCLALVLLRSVGAAPQKDNLHRAGLSPAGLGLFVPSTECVACHNGLSTAENEDVSIGTMWRSRLM